jgi:hypothetical protein
LSTATIMQVSGHAFSSPVCRTVSSFVWLKSLRKKGGATPWLGRDRRNTFKSKGLEPIVTFDITDRNKSGSTSGLLFPTSRCPRSSARPRCLLKKVTVIADDYSRGYRRTIPCLLSHARRQMILIWSGVVPENTSWRVLWGEHWSSTIFQRCVRS